jgi:hypothetical protein
MHRLKTASLNTNALTPTAIHTIVFAESTEKFFIGT